MDDKTKKALGFMGSGALFIGAGVTTLVFGNVPDWMSIGGTILGLALGALGIILPAKP